MIGSIGPRRHRDPSSKNRVPDAYVFGSCWIWNAQPFGLQDNKTR